jgi:hypothetical protein
MMHAAFAILACLSMLGSYAGLTHYAPAPARLAPAIALGLIAGCALALALA